MAFAGLVIDASVETQGNPPHDSRSFSEGDDLRFELRDRGKQELKRFLLFNARDKKITVVEVAKKSYTVVTRETFKQISNQINTLAAMLSKNPENMQMMLGVMPPEQRRQVEAALEAAKPGKKAPKKAGKPEKQGESKVGEWPCVLYAEASKPLVKVSFCSAPYEKLGAKASDMKVYEALVEMLEDGVFQAFGGDSISLWTKEQLSVGFPVETKITDKETGVVKSLNRVTKIEKKNLDRALFQLDPGYQELTLGSLTKAMPGAAGKPPSSGAVPLPPPDK